MVGPTRAPVVRRDVAPVVRRDVARVVFLDEEAAVLLFSARDPATPDAPEVWFTPGGGAEPGESLEDAARREVYEETGHAVTDLGPVVWRRAAEFSFDGIVFEQDEAFFVVRTERFEVEPTAWTEIEKRATTGWRWWTQEELAATNAPVFPVGLAGLLEALEPGR